MARLRRGLPVHCCQRGARGVLRGERTERMPSAPTTRSAVAEELSLNVSLTPAAPRSVMPETFFASWIVPGQICESNADCSFVRCVRIGARPPPTLVFSRRCNSSPLLPLLDRPFLSALQPLASHIMDCETYRLSTVHVSCPLSNASATPSNSSTRHEFAPMLIPAPTSLSSLACS